MELIRWHDRMELLELGLDCYCQNEEASAEVALMKWVLGAGTGLQTEALMV